MFHVTVAFLKLLKLLLLDRFFKSLLETELERLTGGTHNSPRKHAHKPVHANKVLLLEQYTK
jgi:hypothetical protein